MPRTASQPSGSKNPRKKNGKTRANEEEEFSQRNREEGSGEDVDMEDDGGEGAVVSKVALNHTLDYFCHTRTLKEKLVT